MKKLFLNILTFICIVVICISGYKIYTTLKDYKKADDVYSQLRDTKEDSKNMSEATRNLSSINSDYKFWINVEGTNIDYPVVQGSDNDFYLNHDYNKNYLPAGSIFLDYRNNLETDSNSVIYGHHMRNSTMFGQMEKFKDENFFKNNKIITIKTNNTTYTYEIFAMGVYDADFGYNNVNFTHEKDFNDFLNKILGKSMYSRDIVTSKDKILTLSTCSYEYDNARIAIFAVKK
ncbi:class B sortase [Terrisporobacter mayombei]|uniref:Sortase B n=1 Tax=Terrisporobacter mayombei TaxID=1541 RepID=A0ABY9Q2U4_9FIRM|nr:class B sortase [Terrisporobacter mayombei]MCC3867531.1 class B sortase [Terrisporobacter mayombei]WMT81793.1 Sortase B [Terrisporobacter mayombei]